MTVEITMKEEQANGILAQAAHNVSPADEHPVGVVPDSAYRSEDEKPSYEFNEQTNYVRPKTIITVSRVQYGKGIPFLTDCRYPDLSGLRECRSRGSHGPDDTSCQFEHHRKRPQCQQSNGMDRQRLFHVSLTKRSSNYFKLLVI